MVQATAGLLQLLYGAHLNSNCYRYRYVAIAGVCVTIARYNCPR